MSDETTKKQVLRKLLAGKLKRVEYVRTAYQIVPEHGTTMDDILKPEYWAHVGKSLRSFDQIEIRFEDNSRYVLLLVVGAGNLWAKVVVLIDKDLTQEAAVVAEKKDGGDNENAEYEVKWKGNTFAVIRKSDGQIIEKGFDDKAAAQSWLDQYIKTIGAQAA